VAKRRRQRRDLGDQWERRDRRRQPSRSGIGWQVASVGDFNGDGRSDILWQNSSGAVAIWELNGTSIIGGGSLSNPGPSWHAMGSGNFSADGKSDILWQNDSGQVAIWEMNGTTVIGGGSIANPGPTWHI
jgi:hypothetical protein